MSNTIIFYNYYEKNQNYKDNFLHFLEFGICENYDYYLILIDGICSIDLSVLDSNVKILSAPNKNLDYGGYSYVINNISNIDDYDYYFFINNSVRGPYIPPYQDSKNWINYFIKKFTDNVGLVATSINHLSIDSEISKAYKEKYEIADSIKFLTHAQTTAYALCNASFLYLKGIGFYNIEHEMDKIETIASYEIRLSQILLKTGYLLNCLLPEYNSSLYDIEEISGDILYKDFYLGRTIHPYEVMFIKTERDLWPDEYLYLLSNSMLSSKKKTNNFYTKQSIEIERTQESNKKENTFLRTIKKITKGLLVNINEINE